MEYSRATKYLPRKRYTAWDPDERLGSALARFGRQSGVLGGLVWTLATHGVSCRIRSTTYHYSFFIQFVRPCCTRGFDRLASGLKCRARSRLEPLHVSYTIHAMVAKSVLVASTNAVWFRRPRLAKQNRSPSCVVAEYRVSSIKQCRPAAVSAHNKLAGGARHQLFSLLLPYPSRAA
ncbi:hypothetical protein F5X98DRAFT_95611 [Xylaria grammica]|nr:hypothetical protein F5X98DRAFT_95611 [Xylaria grammica]